MKPKFAINRNARIFLFQYLLSNLYEKTYREQLQEVFWFPENEIDETTVEKYIAIYELNISLVDEKIRDYIQSSDNVTIAIVKVAIVLSIALETKKLVISECLKLADLFVANSAFINAVLEKLLPSE